MCILHHIHGTVCYPGFYAISNRKTVADCITASQTVPYNII